MQGLAEVSVSSNVSSTCMPSNRLPCESRRVSRVLLVHVIHGCSTIDDIRQLEYAAPFPVRTVIHKTWEALQRSRYTQSCFYPCFTLCNHSRKKHKQSDAACHSKPKNQKLSLTRCTHDGFYKVTHAQQHSTIRLFSSLLFSTLLFSTHSSCPILLYLPLPASPLPFFTRLLIQPPTPSSRSESLFRTGLPS